MSSNVVPQTTDKTAGTLDYATPAAATEDRFRVGTLRYTKAGLFLVFTWMLWGDFCFTMMERVVPQIMPLQLRSLGASNATINLLVMTLPAVMNMFITPIVSVRSDRHRSRRGRRIPFLLWPTPFVTLFLVLLGYSPQISGWIHRAMPAAMGPNTLALTLFGVFMVLFQFFNMFVASVYYYLFNDVVPAAFLGRFVALFGIVGSGAGFVFNLLIFPYAETHASQIYVGMGILYFVAFFLMCRYVKEGEYPPPPEATQRESITTSIRTYFRECFCDPFYLLIFGRIACWYVAMTSGTFVTFFGQQIGLDLTQIGRINAANVLVMTLALYPMGSLVDRFHPVRMHLLSLLIIPALTLAFFFFARGYWSFMVLSILIAPAMALMSASVFPLVNAVFPKDRFGQFCSAQALLSAVAMMGGSYISGRFMDAVGDFRFLYLWMSTCQACSAACMLGAYLLWRQRKEFSLAGAI
jgi:MFS family permease